MQGSSRGDSHGGGGDGDRWPTSPTSSSSSGPAAGQGRREGKRLTPDTGSEDEYGDDENEKDEEGGYELQEGVGEKHDEEGPRSSDERESRPRRRRELYTPEEEQAVVRKFDRRLVVFVALLYLLSFLDRSSMSPSLQAFKSRTDEL
jgi:hypothetical protein